MIAVAAIARRRSFNCGSMKENRVASDSAGIWRTSKQSRPAPVIEFIFLHERCNECAPSAAKKKPAAGCRLNFLVLGLEKKLMAKRLCPVRVIAALRDWTRSQKKLISSNKTVTSCHTK
jgi:hypothetical protein